MQRTQHPALYLFITTLTEDTPMARFGDGIHHKGPSHTCGYRMNQESYDNIATELAETKPRIAPHRARHRHDKQVLEFLNDPANLRVKRITGIVLY
jgi:hypothetical protein